MDDLSHATWHKSTLGGANGCVEVAFVGSQVAVRDSKNTSGPVLLFPLSEWEAFVAHLRDGEVATDGGPGPEGKYRIDPKAGISKQLDLPNALRAVRSPAALAVCVGTGSKWFLLVAILYYRPVHDFLAAILEALAERWARRIRHGRIRGKHETLGVSK
jgi:hypothetical protein